MVGTSTQAPSSDIDICPSFFSKFMAKANGKKGATIDKDDDVMSGKRKRTVPKKFESPFALDKPGRRTSRGQRTSSTSTATRGTVTNILNFFYLLPMHMITIVDVHIISCSSIFEQ